MLPAGRLRAARQRTERWGQQGLPLRACSCEATMLGFCQSVVGDALHYNDALPPALPASRTLHHVLVKDVLEQCGAASLDRILDLDEALLAAEPRVRDFVDTVRLRVEAAQQVDLTIVAGPVADAL